MSPGYTIGIAGSGGDGVILLGELLARTAASAGLHCYLTKSFGPQIRGGETSCRLTVSTAPLHSPGDRVDLLAVLGWDGLAHFGDELACAPFATVLSDARDAVDDELLARLGAVSSPLALPLDEVAQHVAGSKLARNMVLAGKILHALDWPVSSFTAQLAARLGKHGADELARNERAVQAGHALATSAERQPSQASGSQAFTPAEESGSDEPRASAALPLLSGNEAVVQGALAAGCRFMAGYPISPATEILESMMRALPPLGGNCVQAEDEIAAAGLALGAAYGRTRSMTATSGPGLSLKVETLGLAVMAEQPLVVVDVQRCGPSTGIPTRTEQGDLNIAIYGRHGDAPLPVLAPVSIADCLSLTRAAFEIADALHTPVILLSDQHLAQSVATVPAGTGLVPSSPDRDGIHAVRNAPGPTTSIAAPKRGADGSGSLVSADALNRVPTGNLTGLEHDHAGLPSSDPVLHQANCTARAEKVNRLLNSPLLPQPATYAPPPADNSGPRVGLLTWGSSFGPCCAAADALIARGIVSSVFAPRLLYPLELEELRIWLGAIECLLVAELNHSGQFHAYLRSQRAQLPFPAQSYARAGGAALSAEELCRAVDRLLDAHTTALATAAS